MFIKYWCAIRCGHQIKCIACMLNRLTGDDFLLNHVDGLLRLFRDRGVLLHHILIEHHPCHIPIQNTVFPRVRGGGLSRAKLIIFLLRENNSDACCQSRLIQPVVEGKIGGLIGILQRGPSLFHGRSRGRDRGNGQDILRSWTRGTSSASGVSTPARDTSAPRHTQKNGKKKGGIEVKQTGDNLRMDKPSICSGPGELPDAINQTGVRGELCFIVYIRVNHGGNSQHNHTCDVTDMLMNQASSTGFLQDHHFIPALN